ncbi:transcriptional regulator BetI [Tepidamorphus sp. 3E244]|uniref:transcriptional regulator BetI n=1 Tax=Tepidamorphus sp. 3E244 TaxID=3385498 RepID=UPI0038FC238B
MPKLGMEPIRRQALIDAAIATIGERGSLDVTVSQIARRAGVSSALAHHYFGNKEALIIATMRHLLQELSRGVRQELARASDPRERISAIVRANFAAEQFAPSTVAAWLVFYVLAQESPEARRLWRVYSRRLASNLRHALRALTNDAHAAHIAAGTAALVDGLYIRSALGQSGGDASDEIRIVEDYVDLQLKKAH